jgi:hypothetical protein
MFKRRFRETQPRENVASELPVRQSLTARIAAKPLWGCAWLDGAFTAVALHDYTVLTSLNALAHPVNLFVHCPLPSVHRLHLPLLLAVTIHDLRFTIHELKES